MKAIKKIFPVVVEITKNSHMKYEMDKKLHQIKLDRILLGSNVYPGDYGFIPKTLELDGDPIDILIWSNYTTFPGCLVLVKIIGGIEMIDDGEVDNKLIGIIDSDPEYQQVEKIVDMPENWRAKTWDFFSNYKKLEKKQTILKGWLNQKEALKILADCQKRYKN